MSVDNMNEVELNLALAQVEYGDRFEADEARAVRDINTGRIIQHPDYGSDANLLVKFTTESKFSKVETFKAGGVPKYVDMDFITIIVPGNRDLTVHAPVTDFYQWRFKREWEAFKRGQEAVMTGTPLELWAALKPSEIDELKHQGIRTVEQLANLSDSVNGVLRNFYAMKAKAQRFLDEAKDTAANGALRAQLDEQSAELAAMRAQLEAVLAATKTKKKPEADSSAE